MFRFQMRAILVVYTSAIKATKIKFKMKKKKLQVWRLITNIKLQADSLGGHWALASIIHSLKVKPCNSLRSDSKLLHMEQSEATHTKKSRKYKFDCTMDENLYRVSSDSCIWALVILRSLFPLTVGNKWVCAAYICL